MGRRGSPQRSGVVGGGSPVSVPSDEESTPVRVVGPGVVVESMEAMEAMVAADPAEDPAPMVEPVADVPWVEQSVSHVAGGSPSPHAAASRVDNAHSRRFMGSSLSRATCPVCRVDPMGFITQWAAMIGAMRILGLLGVTLAASWPTTAGADDSGLALTSLRGSDQVDAQPGAEAAPEEPDPATQPTSSKAPDSTMQPTSSKAPDSTPPPEVAPEEPVEPVEPDASESAPAEEPTLEEQRGHAAHDMAFRRHGIGAHGGISVIPTWLLSNWLASHTNALCRGKIGAFASDRGLNQQDGCNFYAGGHYVYRFSRVLDVSASVQYQRVKVPEGLWLDKARFSGTAGAIDAADYTQVDLGLLAMEVDFIARAPVVVTKNVEFGIGGGGGLGLGLVFGGVFQTPLGLDPSGFSDGTRTDGTCETLEDLGDLSRCTPRWDAAQAGENPPPDPSQLSNPNPDLFADCSSTECNENDLKTFGYRREQGGIPPVIPVVNLILSARIIIKDMVGITVNGGWNTGFYFGGGLQYYFGKAEQDEMTKGATLGKRRRRRSGRI